MTTSKKEDEEFFRYKQALQEYNSEPLPSLTLPKKERYEKGSLLQRVFDPLAGAQRLDNGALFYKLEDKELNSELENEEKLRAEFERLKSSNSSSLEVSEDDANELRIALLQEMEQNSPFSLDEFNEILDKEFSVFKNGDNYSYVKDIRDAFSGSLERSASERILDTIPDHVFWDIKKPQLKEEQRFMNPYNSFRKYHVSSFFDSREYEEYMDRRTRKNNIRDGVSTYRRY